MKKFTAAIFAIFSFLFTKAQTNDNATTLPSGLIWHQLKPTALESEPHATLYFYRKNMSKLVAPLKKMPITLNDSLIGELKLNTMLSIVVKPGKYFISGDKKDKSAIYVNAKAGLEYFINGFIDTDMFTTVYLTAVKPDIARKEIGLPSSTITTTDTISKLKSFIVKDKDTIIVNDNATNPIMREAMFPGGRQAWITYLQQNINSKLGRKYIKLERDQASVQQTVTVNFLVDTTGKVIEVTAKSPADVNPKLEEEAIRVVSNSPKWIPAVQNGKKVIYRQQQNITFENSWK